MCGITGFIDFNKDSTSEILHKMVFSMNHRGPDDSGKIIKERANFSVGLGQARLSIIDLSEAGHQPMFYKNFSIVFNGEIYNYLEIRERLETIGHIFSTKTDTEVILHSFEEWGLKCLDQFIGMFAFVIYDCQLEKIYLFADRVGVKPLYFYFYNGLFLFGSELKAIMSHPKFFKNIDSSVLPNYFHYGNIDAPNTIFQNTFKLLPGHFLDINISDIKLSQKKYWDLSEYYLKPKLAQSYSEIKNELKLLMQSSFNYRMVSDVPVGVFLSGGYDSTAVTAILQSNSNRPLKTFTIGFSDWYNEAPHATNTAEFLGTDHSDHICSITEAQEIIPTLPFFFDEPFGDSSAIPTILVSKLAKKEVTVALSADGGDELFCGYESYFKLNKYLSQLDKIPNSFRKIGELMAKLPKINNKVTIHHKYHQVINAINVVGLKDQKKAEILFNAMKEKPIAYIDNIFSKNILSYSSNIDIDIEKENFKHPLEVAMLNDFKSYLPNDILTKVDRATMSVSLEGREPLLDHRLAAFAAQIPLEYKFNGKSGKNILKDIVHDYIPKEMMDRPKAGFSLPIYNWLRGDLSYLVSEYLSKEELEKSGLFNVEFVLNEIKKFKENRLHYESIIWYLLMFQMWYKRWM